MTSKILSLSEVKTRLSELVAGVQEHEEEVIVTKNGHPAAILSISMNIPVSRRPWMSSAILNSRARLPKAEPFIKYKGISFEEVSGEPLAHVKKRRTV